MHRALEEARRRPGNVLRRRRDVIVQIAPEIVPFAVVVAMRNEAGSEQHDLVVRRRDAAVFSRLLTSLRQADELAFVSNYSMNLFRSLLPQFGHLPARVVYPRTRFDAPDLAADVTERSRPSFVVIVSAEPRKNLAGVIRAFGRMPHADLIVIGIADGASRKLAATPNVRFAGYVEESEKAELIAQAHGLIMPSFAEGFGVPIIEALAVNTPVLCSDIPVFREVAGELADYFDPFSIESICDSVGRVLSGHQETRGKIRARRSELAERFGHHTQARDLLAHRTADGATSRARPAETAPVPESLAAATGL